MLKAIFVAGAALAALSGCHNPKGGVMPFTGGSTTYRSTEFSPKTATMIDLRTGETIFTLDIPPGQELTYDFKEGEGDDPVNTPDLMRYQVSPIGTKFGRLRNSMSVPNAASRRMDVVIRTGPEFAPQPPEAVLRADQVDDRPDWWTPAGGPMPEKDGTGNYDN
jgi:hypothetical protein